MTLEPPKTKVSGKVVYQNAWMTIHEDKTVAASGEKGIYGYLDSKDSVVVVVLDKENRACLLKSFRYPSQSWGWEFPGGGGEGEAVIDASKRELEEETGILADKWEVLGHTLVCNGFMTERQHSCVAYDIHMDGTKETSDEVFTEMRFFTFDEIEQMIEAGEVDDNQGITAFHFAKRWLSKHTETKNDHLAD